MLEAERAYCAKEDELREYLDTYETTHDYDEYHFNLDEIEHAPYVLISILSALHEGRAPLSGYGETFKPSLTSNTFSPKP